MKVHKPTQFFHKFGSWFTLDKVPISQLNPKKKIFETIQPGLLCVYIPDHVRFLINSTSVGFITLETKEAAWVNPLTKTAHRIRTREGVCLAPTLVGASLS